MKIYDIYSDKKKDYSRYVILIKVGNFYETYVNVNIKCHKNVIVKMSQF